MNTYTKTHKTVAMLTVFTMVISAFSFAFVRKAGAEAISAMSITGTGITANSSSVSAAITPTIHFTTSSNLTLAGQSLTFKLNGMSGSITASDLTLTGCSTNTLEAAPGTADNGANAVSITGSTDPVVVITLDSTSGVAHTCNAGAMTLAIASSVVTASSSAANYAIHIQTSVDSGSFFFYVGDENNVQVTASVDNVLSFVVRNSADTADQANVGALAIGPNLCDLGNLSTAGVQTCAYRLKVATNANNGYYVQVLVDGDLRKADHSITNTASGSAVTSGAEGYNVVLAAGSATTGTVTECDGVITTGNCLADGIAWNNATSTIFSNTSASTMYTVDGPNNPSSTDTTNTALVTHRAESDASTPAGTYSQLATYTVTAVW